MINPDAFAQLKQLKQEIKASKPIFKGTIKATSSKFGFVILDDEREIFLPPDEYQKVLPGDKVEVALINPDEDKPSAEIEKLIKSDVSSLIGRYIVKGKGHFIDAEMGRANRWIFVPPNKRNKAKEGSFVEAKLLRHPFKNDGKAQAEILSILGDDTTPGIEEALTIKRYQLATQWPEAVEKQVEALVEQGLNDKLESRVQQIDIPFVTIDSASTQDMDDALYAQSTEQGFLLQIAIADPAALIEEGSAIDLEAQRRATSTYLVDQSIAMLPKALSTDLCSLVPNQNRLALIISLQLTSEGKITGAEFARATICSKAKLSYSDVSEFLEKGSNDVIATLDSSIQTSLSTLKEVTSLLKSQRPTQVLPDRPDYRVRLNDVKKVERIERIDKTIAHNIVEECMIAANHQVACFLRDNKIAALFINHAGAREDRAELIQKVCKAHGLEINPEHLRLPALYQQILIDADAMDLDLPLAALINRNMERSEFTLEAKPHVGMALDCYTTATSPIRKFNDLTIHRILADVIDKNQTSKTTTLTKETAQAIQAQQLISRAAANDLEQWMKCQFAETLKGEQFEGTICGVNSAGFHVRITENGIEGFVNTKAMKTSFNQDWMEHVTGDLRYQLNMPMTVKIKSVNWDRKQVMLELV